MAGGLRCPNSACTHVFPPEQVRPPVRLQCPRCAYTFDIRAAAPPPAPLALPVADALDFTSPAAPAPRPGQRSPRRNIVVIVGSVAGVLVLLLVLWALVGKLFRSPDKALPPSAPFNFTMRELPSAWKAEEELPAQLGCKWAWSRSGPTCLCAVDAEDHEKGFPGQAGLVKGFQSRIEKFLSGMGWTSKAPSSRDNLIKLGSLGGQPAYVLEFEGVRSSVRYVGECFIVEQRGFVYWFFTLSPQPINEDEHLILRQHWNDMRNCFRLLNQREGWMPQ